MNIKTEIVKFGKKVRFTYIKHDSTILMGTGLVLTTVGVAWGIKATFDAKKVIDESTAELTSKDYASEAEFEKAKKAAVPKKVFKLSKVYAGPATLYLTGETLKVFAHRKDQMKKAALSATLAATTATMNAFYQNVANEYGEEKANELYQGLKKKEFDTVKIDADGNETTTTDTSYSSNGCAIYTKRFDWTNVNWNECWDKDINLAEQWINKQIYWANQKFQMYETPVFYGDILKEYLGYPKTVVGQYAGWRYELGAEDVDNCIKCKITQCFDEEAKRSYLLLEFNCTGNILDDPKAGIEMM